MVRFWIGVDSEEQCYKELEDHLAWWKLKMPPIVTSWAGTLIEGGFVYIHGRDHRFRPIFIIDSWKLESFKVPKDQ